MTKRSFEVVTPTDFNPKPDNFETTAAAILAEYSESDIEFVKRNMRQTPDVLVIKTNVYWEIKTIVGNSKRTIQNNLRKADDQSGNIAISLIRTKMSLSQAEGRMRQLSSDGPTTIKRLIVITKTGKVVVIK